MTSDTTTPLTAEDLDAVERHIQAECDLTFCPIKMPHMRRLVAMARRVEGLENEVVRLRGLLGRMLDDAGLGPPGGYDAWNAALTPTTEGTDATTD